jgi:CheY-like chemotaxis protein
VDDQNDSADLLASLLPLVHDCTAHVAYSGAEALVLADLVRPQVVILDITMPGMDGCEAARRMRERSWGKHAFIITLSGWGDEEPCCAQAEIDAHLMKPISIDALLGVLAKGRACLS